MASDFDLNSKLVCAEDKAELSDVRAISSAKIKRHTGKLNTELQTAQ
jgi:hypothetical protein